MSKIRDGLFGLCAANVFVEDGDFVKLSDEAELALSVIEGICVEPVQITDTDPCTAMAGMFPLACCLYVKYGENLLLQESALEEIRKSISIARKNEEAFVGCAVYCGIVGKLLAGRSVNEAVAMGKYLEGYYWNKGNFDQMKNLFLLGNGQNPYLQWQQLEKTDSVRGILDWTAFFLFRMKDYRQCVQWAAEAKMEGRQHLAAVVGAMAGLIFGYEGIPSEWIQKLADRVRIEQCCERLEAYWNRIEEEKGIGYACNKEDRWI